MFSLSIIDEYSESCPESVGCAEVIQISAGVLHRKVARSVFMDYHIDNWNPYWPFATAEKWRTIALASKQQLGLRTVDDWIKGNLWKVKSFTSAENMW